MSKRFLILVLLLVLGLAACGGGDDLTAEKVEDAFKKAMEGDASAANEITCEAERIPEDENPFEGAEDVEVTIDCERDGDVMSCTMTIPVEGGEPFVTTQNTKIVDGKLCGTQ